MRTTLNLDDDLLRAAKRLAAERGTTLTALMEDALRIVVRRTSEPKPRKRRKLPTSGTPGAGFPPGVNLDSNAAMLELMDEGLPLDKLR
ncbi:MAG: type II toxin-antitoxin system VapB family antitoxin [Actinobacteria bacterium]|nr:type II toxin-antitoxin system VapB family antitoxin [Actinomycetota bacterium]